MSTSIKEQKIQIICPICKKEKYICISKELINQSKQLTTISIQKGLICNHHFQAFVDKNYKVRGYQKIDLELTPKGTESFRKNSAHQKEANEADLELFKNLILEENYVEYNPKHIVPCNNNAIKDLKNTQSSQVIPREKSLEEIYEEFWDFIDDNNFIFKEFIIKDRPRRNRFKSQLNAIEPS